LPGFRSSQDPLAGILQQLHEAEIHVKLHVAVEKGQPRIVRDEIHSCGTAASNADHVLHQSRSWLPRNLCNLERVTVQMEGMYIATIVVEQQPVSLALLEPKPFDVGEGLPIDRPMIEILSIPRNLFEAILPKQVRVKSVTT